MTNLDSILKSRDITLPTKVCIVKPIVFPVVMYGCESWTVKKAERWKIDAFELWCRRRLLRIPWTERRSNQSILKEISPGCSLEGLMLKLKLQCFGHLMRRVDSLEKTLMLGGIGGSRRRGRQKMSWLDGITDSMDMGVSRLESWWRTGRVSSDKSVLRLRWPKYWNFSFSISPSNEYSGLISFRRDRLDLFVVQRASIGGTNTSWKALSYPYSKFSQWVNGFWRVIVGR